MGTVPPPPPPAPLTRSSSTLGEDEVGVSLVSRFSLFIRACTTPLLGHRTDICAVIAQVRVSHSVNTGGLGWRGCVLRCALAHGL